MKSHRLARNSLCLLLHVLNVGLCFRGERTACEGFSLSQVPRSRVDSASFTSASLMNNVTGPGIMAPINIFRLGETFWTSIVPRQGQTLQSVQSPHQLSRPQGLGAQPPARLLSPRVPTESPGSPGHLHILPTGCKYEGLVTLLVCIIHENASDDSRQREARGPVLL